MPMQQEELIAVDDAGLEYKIIATSPSEGIRTPAGSLSQRTLLATLRLVDGRYVSRISATEFKVLDGPILKLKNQPRN